jgi:hypothetical protein
MTNEEMLKAERLRSRIMGLCEGFEAGASLEAKEQEGQIAALEAENRKLREALELIAGLQELNSVPIPRYEQARTIARKALGGAR